MIFGILCFVLIMNDKSSDSCMGFGVLSIIEIVSETALAVKIMETLYGH